MSFVLELLVQAEMNSLVNVLKHLQTLMTTFQGPWSESLESLVHVSSWQMCEVCLILGHPRVAQRHEVRELVQPFYALL